MRNTYPFSALPLPYSCSALYPHFDEEELTHHYKTELGAYVLSINDILKPFSVYHKATLYELIMFSHRLPEKIKAPVRKSAGAILNHNLFFSGMSPDMRELPSGTLALAIKESFGTFDALLCSMQELAVSAREPGWLMLASDRRGRLKLVFCPNNETTLPMNLTSLLALDLWEHAYYPKYRADKKAYVTAWQSCINWSFAGQIYSGALNVTLAKKSRQTP